MPDCCVVRGVSDELVIGMKTNRSSTMFSCYEDGNCKVAEIDDINKVGSETSSPIPVAVSRQALKQGAVAKKS